MHARAAMQANDCLGLDATIDLAGDGSFPASDPPPWNPTRSGAPGDHDPGWEVPLLHEIVQQLRDDVALLRSAFGRGGGTAERSRTGRLRLRRNADAIEERFQDLLVPVKRRPAARGANPSNIEAVLLGDTLRAESVVVGARYASVVGPQEDRATGIAVLLALARILRTGDHGRTIRLVALERGTSASAGQERYLEALLAEGPRVTAMLRLEGLGHHAACAWPLGRLGPLRDRTLALVGGLRTAALRRRVKTIFEAEASGMALSSVTVPLSRGTVPSITLTDAGPIRRNRVLGSSRESLRVDYDQLGRTTQALAAVVRALAST